MSPYRLLSTAATGPSLTVAPAVVTLAAAVTAVSQTTIAPGKSLTLTLTLTLTNTGNVNSTGAATVTITLTDTASAATVPIPAIATKTTVKFGGKPVKLKLKVKVPIGTTASSYDPTVTFAQAGTSATAIGTTAVAVSRQASTSGGFTARHDLNRCVVKTIAREGDRSVRYPPGSAGV